MRRSMWQRMLLVMVSIGWWGSVEVIESQGQICQNNYVCTADPNTVSADYATVGGGGNNTASGFFSAIGGGGGDPDFFTYGNTASGDYSTISGGADNLADGFGASVCGGVDNRASGAYATVGGGGGVFDLFPGGGSFHGNIASGKGATVGGGALNRASGDFSTIGGGGVPGGDATGFSNRAIGTGSTIGGGAGNMANGAYATVSGGGGSETEFLGNTALSDWATVSGGRKNFAKGSRATISGGTSNTASGFGSMIPGGYNNLASGNFSFAAGRQARALHNGAFVWADTSPPTFFSTRQNQFNVRASGGVHVFSNAVATTGVRLLPGSNAWSIASDRALKEDFHPLDKQQVLAKVQQLSIQNWKLRDEAGNVRHVGPVAQEFQTAFGLGSDERYLHSGDVDGIALVAIQALAEQVEMLQQKNMELQRQNTALQMQMSRVLRQAHTLIIQEQLSGHGQEVALHRK